jgi:1-acyl-sn-glycerol-3-phosphate acyltransferase
MFWWLMKYVILGPWLRLLYRRKATGLENVPAEGPAILAANHQSFLDDLLLPLVVRRKITILAKADYFDRWITAWFFKAAGCVPVRREGGSAAQAAIKTAVEALREGKLIALFPEGTRSPDGRLYRGKTGVARIAMEARVPVIPVAIVGTYQLWPYDRKLPRAGRTEVRFGKPLSFERRFETPIDRFVLRSATDEIMYEIMMLSGQEYVDDYGSRAKAQIDARRAEPVLPEAEESGTTPGQTGTTPEEPIIVLEDRERAESPSVGPSPG